MGRLNKTLKRREKAIKKQKKSKALSSRKNFRVPVYDVSGNTVASVNKERNKKVLKITVIVVAIAAFIYVPQLFIKDTTESPIEVNVNTQAAALSNTALRDFPNEDFDGDGLNNSEENKYGTNPWRIDSDGDGLVDGAEINITQTDPMKQNRTLQEMQTKNDKKLGKELASPYSINNVILWATNYESKSYGSVVQTINGYRFCGFKGYAQFPEDDSKYVYSVKNGKRELLPYREKENIWEINNNTVEIYSSPLEEIIEIDIFERPVYVKSNKVLSTISAIFPEKGFIAMSEKTRIDVEPETTKDVTAKITKPTYSEDDNSRFTVNSNTLNDLVFVRDSIKEVKCCVAVSLYAEDVGEYLGIIYGYASNGDLLIADMDTLKPVGTLTITEKAKMIMDKNGNIASTSYFDFSGFGFNSLDGARISFFAASPGENGTSINNLLDEQKTKHEEEEKAETSYGIPKEEVNLPDNNAAEASQENEEANTTAPELPEEPDSTESDGTTDSGQQTTDNPQTDNATEAE